MTSFAPSRAYESQLDVRFVDGRPPAWATRLVHGGPPNSSCWLVLLPRRGGKTWLAQAIERARGERETVRVDLRRGMATARKAGVQCLLDGKRASRQRGGLVLVDEPGLATGSTGGVDPEKFAAGLALLRSAGAVPVVLSTPRECAVLIHHLGPDAPKDLLKPPSLSAVEVNRMAARVPDWGPAVVEEVRRLDSSWLQSPFLLELLLYVAEEHEWLRADGPALIRAATDEAEQRHDYLAQLLDNGLASSQRTELRSTRWRVAGIDLPPLGTGSMLTDTTVPGDPMVARHLPEVLRIHHLSDLHHGGPLRSTVDLKDRSQAGRHVAKVAGAGTPLDSYLGHLKELASRNQAPHLVLVTGDLVNRPDPTFGADALAWLAQVRSMLDDHRDLAPDDPRIVLVGGNHDVSWDLSLDPDPLARHRWFAQTFDGYPHPDLDLQAGPDRRLTVTYPGAGLRIVLLGSAESGGETTSDSDRELLAEYQRRFLGAEDDNVIQSLIRSFERLDPGVLSRVMLDRLGVEEGFLTMAALHHPLSPVPSVEIAPYTGVVNAGHGKRALAGARTALVLHGHTHLAFLAAERLLSPGPEWTMRIAGAATLAAATTDEQNGYNQIFVSREGGDHTILVRQVRLDGGQWIAQHQVGFRPGEPVERPLHDLLQDVSSVRR